jgi:LPXTG-motif cell wall-anchored protein
MTSRLGSDRMGDDGRDPRLAQTGSSAVMLWLLLGGLLSMLMSALMLGWRWRR